MSVEVNQLISYLDELLDSNNIKDFCPNGLQIEGCSKINKIVTGVTASEALIDAAIENKADAILVHHGYFWKGESDPITGMKKRRIAKLLKHDINLIAYHLPIDVHFEFGNNIQLAKKLSITNVKPFPGIKPKGIVMQGELPTGTTANKLAKLIKLNLLREPLVNAVRDEDIRTVAWCTGGGQSYIDVVANAGIDAFITGEASEQTIHSSREQNIDFFAAGHHATERYGVQRLGEHLEEQFDLDVSFIDIHNPV
ncbi:Nif3-like dinuclear metal center hexameric protein [Psychrosphaera haliotis]|uniref:GTP cyclohydrolase 1 type 2 homolog n=1 Tax=Psychrosphaera haliotis TaxID=555083 RepID=A0A6N8F4X6_9GAMM|nr:Nif3-like dinuclear metal center hexameric protein [Psychrosphaera haliotis]MUH71706.1 Nif3-like dinuclear metal center hexameric protein [Psychrosphaera haliotis]